MSEKHEIEVRLFSLALFVLDKGLSSQNGIYHFLDKVDHKAQKAIEKAKKHFDAVVGYVPRGPVKICLVYE